MGRQHWDRSVTPMIRYLKPAVITVKARELIHTKFRKALGNDHKLGTLLSMFNNDEWEELKWEQFCLL